MPEDDRTRRRLGDATKSRIADLASGWSVDPAAPEAPEAADQAAAQPPPPPPAKPAASSADHLSPGPVRSKPKTNPPPPPGSPERKALETKIIATTTRDDESTEEVPPERRGRSTGAHAAIPTPADARNTAPQGSAPRPRVSTGAHVIVRAPTGSQPAVNADPRATQPHAGVPGRSKAPSIPPPPPGSPERSKPPTLPPPPPGSPARADANRSRPVSAPPPAVERSRPISVPPTIERSRPVSAPPLPTGPKFPRAGYDGPQPPLATSEDAKPFATEQRTPAVIVDVDAFAGNKIAPAAGELKARAEPVVPVGEFDRGVATVDVQQVTAKREPAEALLAIPDAETPVEELEADEDDVSEQRPMRGDPTALDPQTAKFERGDPTNVAPPDATEIQAPFRRSKQMTGGTLRRSAALRRKRGLYGDVRYVFTALFGVRRSHRELAELEHRQEVREISRRRHLITAGRAAATMDNFDHPALGRSRDTLAAIEDERAKHAGAVAASDAELDRVRRDRETNTKAFAESLAKADAEIADLAKKIEPLEKEASASRKKAAELRDEVQRIDRKIADTTALLVSVKGEKLDKADVHADIASLKANKEAVLRDEPTIAAQLDGLNPRIAALEGTRSELQKKKLEIARSDQDDQRRTLELLEAIGAKRKVVERASADAETARDNALFELGERLYVDRPSQLTPQLSPIDRIDLEIGEDERRSMELKEILSNIDKTKFARGLAMIILVIAGAGVVAWLVLDAM